MSCDSVCHLMVPFSEAELSEFERYQLLSHLKGCTDCREELELIEALYTVAPEPPAWGNLSRAIDNELMASVLPSTSWAPIHFITTVAYLALFVLFFNWANTSTAEVASLNTPPIRVLVPRAQSAPLPAVQFRSASFVPNQRAQPPQAVKK